VGTLYNMDARILVVEDEPLIAMDIKFCLLDLGYEVVATLTKGEDAVTLAAEENLDCIMMDINLAGNMDGIEAAIKIKEFSDVPVIFLTANADKSTITRAKEANPFSYIIKPFDERDLQSNIEMALSKHDQETKLKDSHSWLKTILGSIGDGVVAIDEHGKIQLINGTAESLLGWSSAESKGQSFLDIFNAFGKEDTTSLKETLDNVVDGEAVGPFQDYFLQARDGHEFPINFNAAPIRGEENDVVGAVFTFQDITKQKQLESQLRDMAITDELTGVYNRLGFFTMARQHCDIAHRQGLPVLIFYADLDGMKYINDNYGHKMGDQAIIDTAEILKETFRRADIICRLGGDEFVGLLMPKEGIDETILKDRLDETIARFNIEKGRPFDVAISIGFSCGDCPTQSSLEELLHSADERMYVDKQSRKVTQIK
jgi:diguanylate cyclase (GGDEF)-like protein/PAS domain S-box-containing protein